METENKKIAVIEVCSPDFEEESGQAKQINVIELTVSEAKERNNIPNNRYKYYKLEEYK